MRSSGCEDRTISHDDDGPTERTPNVLRLHSIPEAMRDRRVVISSSSSAESRERGPAWLVSRGFRRGASLKAHRLLAKASYAPGRFGLL